MRRCGTETPGGSRIYERAVDLLNEFLTNMNAIVSLEILICLIISNMLRFLLVRNSSVTIYSEYN